MGGRGASSSTSRARGKGAGERGHVSGLTYQDAKFIAKELGVSKIDADRYYSAITYFIGEGFGSVRRAQRSGTGSEKALKTGRDYEEYISKAPKWNGGVTYRGASFDDIAWLKVGEETGMGGTSSWTTSNDVAKAFAMNDIGASYHVVFRSPTQKKGTSIRHLSERPYEGEVAASTLSRYAVKKIIKPKGKRGVYYIDLEEVG
jgi:hypothetical protein